MLALTLDASDIPKEDILCRYFLFRQYPDSLLKQLFLLIVLQGCVGLQSPLITPCLEFSFIVS